MSAPVVLGTPLSASATKVMLLGSGELGKEVIIALQRFGVEVIAVDRYQNAPGQQVAHRAYTIDMTDGEALKSLVEREKPHLIVPEIEALNTDALADIEQAGISTVIPTVKAVQLTMNREGIRVLAAETLKLPTSPYAFARSEAELKASIDAGIGYPCYIKPTMSSSGKGQSRITQADEVKAAWDYAQAMTEAALKAAQDVAKSITDALGGLGLFGVELFVKGDQVWFSEVSPRPHDTGMVTMCSQRLNEFELHARAILGLPVDVGMTSPGASAVIYGGVDSKTLQYTGLEAALAVPNSDIRLFGKPESFKRRRMGVALATAADTSAARELAKEAASCVKPKAS